MGAGKRLFATPGSVRSPKECEELVARAIHHMDGVDVLVRTPEGVIAFEVEVSGTNAEENLRRNAARDYDRIVFVAVGAKALKRLRRRLGPPIKKQGLERRVSLITLAQLLKMDGLFTDTATKMDENGPEMDAPVST